jgi:hypothetical protein
MHMSLKVQPYVQATTDAAGDLVLSAPWWPPPQQATSHANMQSSTAGATTLAFIMLALVSVSAVAFNRSRHAAEPWQQGTCTQDIPQPGRGGQEPHRAMNAAVPESMCVSIGDQTAHQDAATPTPEENLNRRWSLGSVTVPGL